MHNDREFDGSSRFEGQGGIQPSYNYKGSLKWGKHLMDPPGSREGLVSESFLPGDLSVGFTRG